MYKDQLGSMNRFEHWVNSDLSFILQGNHVFECMGSGGRAVHKLLTDLELPTETFQCIIGNDGTILLSTGCHFAVSRAVREHPNSVLVKTTDHP